LAYHLAHAAMQGSMEFAAHYMLGGRTTLLLAHPD
jgi:hypothetical protein